jgi:urea transport system ATP-binding protein
MSILNIDGVSKSFDGFRAINDLNLAIDSPRRAIAV